MARPGRAATDVAAAQKAYASLSSVDSRKCLGVGFAKVIADNVKGDGIDVSDPTTGELRVRSVGDRVAASRISLQLEDDGDSVDVSVDLVLMLQGRTINQLATVDLLTTFDEDLRAKLLTRAAELVEQAQGSS